jgi:ATP-binding cassette subfamily B multidrug efflux pump
MVLRFHRIVIRDETREVIMEVFKRLKPLYEKDRVLLISSIIFLICSTVIGLAYPILLGFLIDDVIGKNQYHLVPKLSLLVLAVVTVKACFVFLSGFFGTRFGNRLAFSLRNALYDKLQTLSFQYYDKARTGDLMSRLTADLEAIRLFLGFGFSQMINAFLMVLFGSILMLTISWKLTLFVMITMPFLVWTALRFEGLIHLVFRNIRKSMSDLTTAVQENITGVRTVKSFARESQQINQFGKRSDNYKDNNLESSRIWSIYFPLMELFANLTIVILLAVGGFMVIDEQLTVGELVKFFSLNWFIIAPLWQVGFHINAYTQSKASGERVLEILDHYVHVKDKPTAIKLQSDQIQGHVRYENVSFAYQDKKPALIDFNLDAKPGNVIGILGGTGAGKSTIIQLLMRAYNVKEGRITLDGRNIADLSLESLRSNIAVVFQETFLFSSSIRNNISYGNREINMEQIIEAAKLAKAHDFIMELPLGYNTIVGERGLGLSGGQKQRIAIARALLKDPKILILDDSTSAVDMETEHEIQTGFRQVMKGRTTFIIAHRISSLQYADEILVLDKGRVVQRGKHKDLLNQHGLYLDTYNIQYADRPNSLDHKSDAVGGLAK